MPFVAATAATLPARACSHTWLAASCLSAPTASPSPAPCSPLCALRQLSLEGCRSVALLDGGLAAAAPFLSSLTSLNLQGCSSLTDAGLAKMGCLTALASLNLSECPGE